MRDAKKRLRRTMMFLNAQKPGLIKDPYIYGADSLMLDLEDAVAENQKDAARFSLFHALRTIDYHGAERIVRINGLDTPFWKEDIRCAVAGGCDGIRIPKTETAQDVKIVEQQILKAENEFGRPENSTLIMAAIESARGVVKALEICEASKRLFGIALSGGDYSLCTIIKCNINHLSVHSKYTDSLCLFAINLTDYFFRKNNLFFFRCKNFMYNMNLSWIDN